MFNRLHRRFYYGWVIVAVSLLINLASVSINPAILAFFVSPMLDDLGWSRGELALSLTLRFGVAGISAPLMGTMLDRLGARWLGALTGLTAGISIMAIALVHSLPLYYALSALTGLSGLGGQTGQLLTTVPVGKWFHFYRGRALAIATLGLPIGGIIMFPSVQVLIENFGWRATWAICGASIILITVPLCLLFMRKDPESMGLHVDGAAEAPPDAGGLDADGVETGSDWTPAQVFRTRALWLILGAVVVSGIVIPGTTFYRVSFWEDVGISPSTIAVIAILEPISSATAMLFCGFLVDRMKTSMVGFIGCQLAAISILPMIFAHNSLWMIVAYYICWGVGIGASYTATNTIWPEYFGRRFLGSIRGIVYPAVVGVSAASPPLFALIFSAVSDDRYAWIVTLTGFTLAGWLLLAARPPRRATARSQSLSGASGIQPAAGTDG